MTTVTHTHTHKTVLRPFFRDYPGEPRRARRNLLDLWCRAPSFINKLPMKEYRSLYVGSLTSSASRRSEADVPKLNNRVYTFSSSATVLLNPVYTIQPVAKPVVQPGLTTGLTTVLNEQPLTTGCIHDTAVCQTGLTTRLTTGLTNGCIVYTNIYPVIKLVVQPV